MVFTLTDVLTNMMSFKNVQASAQPLLMQIRLPPNYGKRYMETFSAIYPALASRYAIPLLPNKFICGRSGCKMTGYIPIRTPSPSSRKWMADRLLPLLKHES